MKLTTERKKQLAESIYALHTLHIGAICEMWGVNPAHVERHNDIITIADYFVTLQDMDTIVQKGIDLETFTAWYDYGLMLLSTEVGRPINLKNFARMLQDYVNKYGVDSGLPRLLEYLRAGDDAIYL
jgi:hypothetical protein